MVVDGIRSCDGGEEERFPVMGSGCSRLGDSGPQSPTMVVDGIRSCDGGGPRPKCMGIAARFNGHGRGREILGDGWWRKTDNVRGWNIFNLYGRYWDRDLGKGELQDLGFFFL
ncbi:hypothetical protein Patl1_11253 [Pistacia atlantica]|uniref:Uncharacterized protein n=1 Tax=Pistacia atlantica TaxID=434234 RepID=A0ACC1A3E7_9ROSI|nr:hypothetical protein Patl1_11253 [Pistacia atlantica]